MAGAGLATRVDNVHKHPGKPDMPEKRRKTAEVNADNEAKEKAKETSKRKREASIQKAARVEDQMKKQDDEEQKTRVTRGMRPVVVLPASTSGKNVPVKCQLAVTDA